MRYAAFLFTAVLLVAGCASDYPDGVHPVSDSPPWAYPDTVASTSMGEVRDIKRMDIRWDTPSRPVQAWLQEHGYVFDRVEPDTETTKLLSDEGDYDLKSTHGNPIIFGRRIYVRVE